MFGRKKAPRAVIGPLPVCAGDLSADQVNATHQALVAAVSSVPGGDVQAMLAAVSWTPRNVMQLVVLLAQQVAQTLDKAGFAYSYADRPEPTDPVERAAHLVVVELIRNDQDTALLIARSLAEPRDPQRPDVAPQIGPAIVAHLVGVVGQVQRYAHQCSTGCWPDCDQRPVEALTAAIPSPGGAAVDPVALTGSGVGATLRAFSCLPQLACSLRTSSGGVVTRGSD